MAYMGFDKLKASIAAKGGASNPGAVAAAIGRRKYGAKAMAHASATGTSLRRHAVLQHMHGSGEADRHSYPRTTGNMATAHLTPWSAGSSQELERGLPIHGRTGGVSTDDRKTHSDYDLSKSDNFGQGTNRGVTRGGGGPGGTRGSGAQFQYVGANKASRGGGGPGGTHGSGAQFQYVGARGGKGHGGVRTGTARANSGPEAYAFSGRGPNNMQPISGSHGTPDRGARAYGAPATGTARRTPRMPTPRNITPSRTHYVDPNAYRTNFLGTYR